MLENGDKPREACGVVGIWAPPGHNQVASYAYLGLYALQHRGQESAGIVVSDGEELRSRKGMGLVSEVFDRESLTDLQGHLAIGHVRYSTSGGSSLANAQPLLVRCSLGVLALAHNGNLVNTEHLRRQLMAGGSVFQSTTDSEVIINLMAGHGGRLEEAFAAVMKDIQGAYSIVAMNENTLLGARDPYGFRPLCLGRLGETYILASETCALGNLGADLIREVAPGEIIVIDECGLRTIQGARSARRAFCLFEYIYFARPDSQIAGRNVHLVRKRIGRQLARENPAEADIVIAAPDSGTSAALGFAEESGLPFELGLVKNRYVGRTFIQPEDELRKLGVRIKLNPIVDVLRGKRVVIIDDSIVRGTTSKKTVQLVREAGAKEVYMYVASPPYMHPCYYGIDIPTSRELIAAKRAVDDIRQIIGADRLAYVSLDGLCRAIGLAKDELCTACFSGSYCTVLPEACQGSEAQGAVGEV